jgi:hypothetical protein
MSPKHHHVNTLHGQRTQADVVHGPARGAERTPAGSHLLLQPKSQTGPTVPVRTHLEYGTKQRVRIYVPVVIACSLHGGKTLMTHITAKGRAKLKGTVCCTAATSVISGRSSCEHGMAYTSPAPPR